MLLFLKIGAQLGSLSGFGSAVARRRWKIETRASSGLECLAPESKGSRESPLQTILKSFLGIDSAVLVVHLKRRFRE